MTTSTRPVPLLVPDSDTGVRCPSDVFTGDAELSILEASKILGYSEGGLMKAIREERVDLIPHQARGGLRVWRSDLDVVIADMTRRAARHGSYCPLSTPSFGYVEDCQCVACHCGDDHEPGGFLGTCQAVWSTPRRQRESRPMSYVNKPKAPPGAWAELANCIGLESDLFFPGKHDGGVITSGARMVCAACVVRSDCLAYAMQSPMERHGVWGGTSFRDRERLRRQGVA